MGAERAKRARVGGGGWREAGESEKRQEKRGEILAKMEEPEKFKARAK